MLGACDATPAATLAPAATPAPASSAPPAQTQAPNPTVSSVGVTLSLADGPILGPDDGPANAQFVMPAAGTRARDGELVLVLVWFGTNNAPPRIATARSSDGVAWEVDAALLLDGLAIGFADPGPIPTGIVQLDDGSWQLFGWAAATSSGASFLNWRASAPVLEGPWALDGTELLTTGPAGSWDSFAATIGSVLRSEDGYLAWYEGEPPGRSIRGDIGLARSPDGLAWTKVDDPATTAARLGQSDPVISSATCGAATALAVEQPQVERVGDRYVALFGGFSATSQFLDVFAAVSADGRAWQCASPEPLLRAAELDSSEGIHTMASVPLADGRIGLVLESLNAGGSDLWWATVELADRR